MKYARTASRVFPSTTTPRHTSEACLSLGLGLGFRLGMVATVSREAENNVTIGETKSLLIVLSWQNPTSLKQLHFMRALFEQVRLCGQIYRRGLFVVASKRSLLFPTQPAPPAAYWLNLANTR